MTATRQSHGSKLSVKAAIFNTESQREHGTGGNSFHANEVKADLPQRDLSQVAPQGTQGESAPSERTGVSVIPDTGINTSFIPEITSAA